MTSGGPLTAKLVITLRFTTFSGIRYTGSVPRFWTDRKTVGHMAFTERTDEIFSRFVDAKTHFDAKAKS